VSTQPVASSAVRFWVAGKPAAQGSKNVSRYGGVYERSKNVAPWRDAVRGEAQRVSAPPFTAAVAVTIVFIISRPKAVRRLLPAVRPDLDKYARSTLDALTMSGLIGDDGQVTTLVCRKRYGQVAGAMITVEEDTYNPEERLT
jgi:crossover junction endodeoxyribonuclease RusA